MNNQQPTTKAKPYALIDAHTGKIVGRYATANGAYLAGDRKDQAYGAVRYVVRRMAASV